ncbi:MAG: hypothetical protein HYR84_07000 [Planctomycetes bacterium]|nr:hypothetical protein [Planctomycetota bacterium]
MAKKKREHLESLTIVSADGTPRIKLATDPTHGLPLIEFFGHDGITRRLCFGLNPEDTPFLCMLRKDGTAAVSMGVNEEGEAGVTAYHTNGLPAVRVRIHASGDIELELIDRNDKISRVWIDNQPKEPEPKA